jgi:hypothetical protein
MVARFRAEYVCILAGESLPHSENSSIMDDELSIKYSDFKSNSRSGDEALCIMKYRNMYQSPGN